MKRNFAHVESRDHKAFRPGGELDKQAEAIQLFQPNFRVDECLDEIRECLEIGWTGLGFKTLEIESAWRDFTGLPNAHFVNSATAALHLSLEIARDVHGWQPGDEVITTPLTFVSTNHAIVRAGLSPVFADVDEYMCLSPISVLEKITPRTRAVIFVGLGGSTGQFEQVVDVCRAAGLFVILDAAHMSGTRLKGQDPGHLADVSCHSFQAVKNLPTADSGMVCFAESELDGLARKYSWLGISRDTYSRSHGGTYAWMYDVDYFGDKYHGNSVMAALALVGLRYLEADNEKRRQIAGTYETLLGSVPNLQVVPTPPDCESSRHLFQILVNDRVSIIRGLHQANIFPGVHYRANTDYSVYAEFQGETPLAQQASERLLSLPMHVRLTDDQVQYISHKVTELTT